MTLPRLRAMNDYWDKNPPLHQLVASFVGFKSAEKPPEEKPLGIDDFIKAMGGING